MWRPRNTTARWLCLAVCLVAFAAGAARAVPLEGEGARDERPDIWKGAGRPWEGQAWRRRRGDAVYYKDDDDDDDSGSDEDEDDDDSDEWGDETKGWIWDVAPAPKPRPRPRTKTKPRPMPMRQTGSVGSCGITIEVPRITQGEEAQEGQFPWQAAILYQRGGGAEKETFCGGALVHPRFILTAAHCVDQWSIKGYTLVEVRLGLIHKLKVDANARAWKPDRQIVHPAYRSGVSFKGINNENDIALLRLPQAAPYTEFIRPICLPSLQATSSIKKSPGTLIVAGWGLTENDVHSDTLLFVRLEAVETRACAARHKLQVPETQLCAAGTGGRDSCKGDSGGPLVQPQRDVASGDMAYHVVGLVSFGPSDCGNGAPAVYTNVAPYRAWIDQAIRENA